MRRKVRITNELGLHARPAAEFVKNRHSALVGTGLSVWLRRHGIGRLIVTGIRTEQCCETTARLASDFGYDVVFVTEATATTPLPHWTMPADATLEEILADPRTLSPETVTERTEYALAGRFATIRTLDELTAVAVSS